MVDMCRDSICDIVDVVDVVDAVDDERERVCSVDLRGVKTFR